MEEKGFKKGDLVKLYNMYEAHIEQPAVVGIYLGTGHEAQSKPKRVPKEGHRRDLNE